MEVLAAGTVPGVWAGYERGRARRGLAGAYGALWVCGLGLVWMAQDQAAPLLTLAAGAAAALFGLGLGFGHVLRNLVERNEP